MEACIAALGPVADEELPTARLLGEATAEAEEAARTDGHWDALAAALRLARDRAGTPAAGPAVDALVAECRRSSDHVRQGRRGQDQAVGFPEGPRDGT